ncbi:MAG: hypothetical protein QNJ09_03990 [Paracoccaceae bacterium]|nr:hypothetical protein [Paracoccaceae bacterium]
MKKDEALAAIQQLIHQWADENGIRYGQKDMPLFYEFVRWAKQKGYGHYFNFRSVEGAMDAAERLFDEELGQSWRN